MRDALAESWGKRKAASASAAGCGASAPPNPAGLRWLARTVLTRDLAALLPPVPPPCLAAEQIEQCNPAVCNYLLWWVTHPDPQSNFAARTRRLLRLSGPALLRSLTRLGYDGLIYAAPEGIIGHVFFQRQGGAVHGFSTAVGEAHAGKGISVLMMLDYLAYAAQLPGVVKARVGAGRNTVTRRMLARIKKHEGPLGWRVADDGWVTFGSGAADALGNQERAAPRWESRRRAG